MNIRGESSALAGVSPGKRIAVVRYPCLTASATLGVSVRVGAKGDQTAGWRSIWTFSM